MHHGRPLDTISSRPTGYLETIGEWQSALIKQRATRALSQLNIRIEDVAKVARTFGFSSQGCPVAGNLECC